MICLSDNMGMVLSYADDVDFESIFVDRAKNVAEPGDLLIGISGSGNSENVLGPSSTPTSSAAGRSDLPAPKADGCATWSNCR